MGDLGQTDVLQKASQEADIVINTAPDITHAEAIVAVLGGIKTHGGNGDGNRYYIHTSGASLIWDEPEGRGNARWWDDIDDIATISALEEKHTHAVTDQIVREAAPDVNVAIISPGFVGGISPSIEHQLPITTPALINTARAFDSGFKIAKGDNCHAWIHVQDLADMYLILVNDAWTALGGQRPPPSPSRLDSDLPLWGPEAYYFASGEDIRFADFMDGLVPVLKQHGIIRTDAGIDSVNVTVAARKSLAGPGGEYDALAPPPPPDSWAMHIAVMYGVNMRLRPSRIERLGWKAKMGSIVGTLPAVVAEFLQQEAKEKAQIA
ncbi:hypothetical protein BD289DRAFT_9329 [Coniella lustricola]|uniref:NAD-dependent epimerase/dehydratase domain-containing protein n=1 Tax=Coniella lustricola TaxID=2025994 RepID=A0A2T3A4K9_9PEZI|nr:hypothetical protein BD289DRAFT_9329 [Coniella lustricola]